MQQKLRLGELCAGYNGLGMAVEEVFGATPAWFSEFDAAPSKILAFRYPDVPNYGDMTAIDWANIEHADIISGGTPCQDLSAAGKRKGMTEGTRSNLWVQMREAIAIQKPKYVVWENVRGAYSAEASSDLEQCQGCLGDPTDRRTVLRALGRVLGDLSDLGYDTQWRGLRAADVGACHGRFRVFILAENVDLATGSERRQSASRQAESGRTRPNAGGRGGTPFADAGSPALGELAGRALAEEAGQEGGNRSGDLDGKRTTRNRRAIAGADEYIGGAVNASSGEVGPIKGLQGVREAFGAEAIRETPGGPNAILGEGALRSDVREQSGRDSSRLAPLASATGQGEEAVQNMLDNLEPACPSQGPKPGEQLAGELGSPLRELPSKAPLGGGPRESPRSETNWGPYEPAIRRWEMVLGRQAPAPTEATGRNGGHRLSPRFTEFMMGLPAGWVTDPAIGISRNDQLKACGNGVVPAQAKAALRDMLAAFEMEKAA